MKGQSLSVKGFVIAPKAFCDPSCPWSNTDHIHIGPDMMSDDVIITPTRADHRIMATYHVRPTGRLARALFGDQWNNDFDQRLECAIEDLKRETPIDPTARAFSRLFELHENERNNR